MPSLFRVGALVMLGICSACSASISTPSAPSDPIVTTNGQLTLTVSDAPSTPGFLFMSANVSGGPKKITVTSTRYGSVCATDVTAHATIASGKVTLDVTYAARTAICTADIRALTYTADIDQLAPGAYDVDVVHTNADGSSGTVTTQRVNVT